ncbi:hypothetical protein L9F63_006453, partial [Diploptera punctata]
TKVVVLRYFNKSRVDGIRFAPQLRMCRTIDARVTIQYHYRMLLFFFIFHNKRLNLPIFITGIRMRCISRRAVPHTPLKGSPQHDHHLVQSYPIKPNLECVELGINVPTGRDIIDSYG